MSRDLLRTHKAMIAEDFVRETSENDSKLVSRSQGSSKELTDTFVIDQTKVTCRTALDQLVAVYAALINLNLTTNILNEISYLLNLLNADYERWSNNPSMEINDSASVQDQLNRIFGNAQNCVYFSMGVLRTQTHVLLMLDLTTIRVLLQNERLGKCNETTRHLLSCAYDKRVRIISHDTMGRQLDKVSSMNVSYQQDIDTKHNFPSSREFGAFNKQRDMFYQILR